MAIGTAVANQGIVKDKILTNPVGQVGQNQNTQIKEAIGEIYALDSLTNHTNNEPNGKESGNRYITYFKIPYKR